MKQIAFIIFVGFVIGIFSGCAKVSDKELDSSYLREPIFIDAKDRQGCKIAYFFNPNDDEKPLNEKIAIALAENISWDGECKDGYANGLGAEIAEDKDGKKRVFIAIYEDRIPRYVYGYKSLGKEYALFMGAFGNIFEYATSDYRYGLSVENNGTKLRLQSSHADIVFDMTYSDDRRLSVNGYELRDILLDTQKAEHKHALKLTQDYKKDLLQSIANYRESLAIAQQYSDKICGESMGESVADSAVDSADLANADSSADLVAIHHHEICALKIDYTAEIETMEKLVEFLGEF